MRSTPLILVSAVVDEICTFFGEISTMMLLLLYIIFDGVKGCEDGVDFVDLMLTHRSR